MVEAQGLVLQYLKKNLKVIFDLWKKKDITLA